MKKTNKQKKQDMKEIERWLAHFKLLQNLMDDMRALFGTMTEGRFENTVWNVFNEYTNLLADKVGDTYHEWLGWYLWDNDAGNRGLEAQIPAWSEPRPIKTLADLYAVING